MPEKVRLPELRPIAYDSKKYHYHLRDSAKERRLAIREGVEQERKQKSKRRSKREAAISKKSRFNVLRIYRKNRKPEECRKITSDMRYMDKIYGLGNTRDICAKSRKRIKQTKQTKKRAKQSKQRKRKRNVNR